ncbi:auxilin-like protein 1 [Aristolochia californica]|uniref:auxilin-like protein 1 n=1 Tax=Aristolochia californica TaxID=171875 RepID=UPI0035D861E4
MADFQQSPFTKRKVSYGNAYDDVFGGPPKYSVPTLSSRVDDYSEIFGNFFASRTSSIPILDFPLLDEDQVALDVPITKFDYTEIFGGFNAGDFAVPYEELFLERQGPQNPTSNSWSPGERATQQAPEVVSTAPLESNDQDLFVSSSMKQSFSNGISEHIYDGSKQFNVSYNKSNQGSKGEPLSGTTHIAHLHDVPGFTVLHDSGPPPNKNKYDNSVVPKKDLSLKGDSNGEIMVETQFREMSSHILGSNFVENTSENEIITDEKYLCSKQIGKKDVLESGKSDIHCFSNQMPSVQKANLKQIHLQSTAPEGASAEDLHNSCDPIAGLPSDGDGPSEKVVFRTISDINLRTQPSQLPPPSRLPPKLGNSKKLKAYRNELYCWKPMRITETYHFGSAFDTCTRQEYDASPPFFDVEVDASSAAAASAAAMSEAMEKAQAKLKSAKESMERKKDGHQGRMELNLNGEKNIKEQRLSRCTHESHTFKDEEAQDSCDRQNPQINGFARLDKCKMMGTADMASDYEWKMGDTELTTASMAEWQEKNFRGSLDEEKAGEWKVEKQYYELLNNEKTFRLTADQENYEKYLKASKAVKEESILEKNKTFKALKESYLQGDSDQKPRVGKTACLLENDKKARPYILDREILKEAKNLQTDQETVEQEGWRLKVDNMVYEHDENEFGLNAACGNEEVGRGLKLAFEHEKEEKRWEATHECVDNENGQKVAHMCQGEKQRLKTTCVHEQEVKRLKAANEHEEEEKGLEAAHTHEEREKKLKTAHEHEEEKRRLKGAREQEEKEKRLKAACEHEEEEKRLKVVREQDEEETRLKAELEEEEKRLKVAREHDEEEKRLKAAYELEEEDRRLKVACKLEDEKKRLEAAFVHKEEKRFNAALVHVRKEKGPKETHECQEDRQKYACETEDEKKRPESETVKASLQREDGEKLKTENQSEERLKYKHEEEENKSKRVCDACDTEGHDKNSKATKGTRKQRINLKVIEKPDEWEENGAKLKLFHNGHESEEDEKKHATVRQQEENKNLLKMAKTKCCCEVNDKKGRGNEKQRAIQDTDHNEKSKMMEVDSRLLGDEDNERRSKEARMGGGCDGNATMLNAVHKILEVEETENKQTMTCEKVENLDEGNSIPLWPGEGRKVKGIHDAHWQAYNEAEPNTSQAAIKQEKNDDKLKAVKEGNGFMKDENSINKCMAPLDNRKGSNQLTAAREIIKEAENRRKETILFDRAMNGEEKIFRTPQLPQNTEREKKSMDNTYDREEWEKEERLSRERELEKERLRKLEEERVREREREKDRLAVERATHEARERAATEALERAERAAVERALADARERAEKASSEAARLRAERAAVERATAEARERAAERERTDNASRQNPVSDLQDFHGTHGESALRSKARLERHQRTVERAAKALAEKKLQDVLVQREQVERNRLAQNLNADIRRWAIGKEGNLRALLSTLQYILGPESGWQPIPLTEVITAVAVKKAYRRATLCVHPDKVQQRGASIQQKYICEKVFDLLKDAWNRFNSEER